MNDTTPRPILDAALRLPHGVARITRSINRWRTDTAGEPDYRAALTSRPGDLLKLRADRETRIRQRTGALALTLGLVLIAAAAGEYFAGPWTWQAGLGLLLLAALVTGPGRRMTDTAGIVATPVETTPPSETLITPDAIAEAFSVALPAVAKAIKENPRALQLRGPVHRDGPGWAATVDLPPGITVEDCVRVRERLASGLRVTGDKLNLSTGQHAGQCGLWVADLRPSQMPTVPWPLADAEQFSLFDPIPIGTDMKGRPVAISLMWGSLIIGGVPQMGKTATLRLIQTAAALDPECKLMVFDMKGGGDSVALEPAATVMRAGDSPEDLDELRAVLESVQADMRAVYLKLRELNAPKLTRDNYREVGAGPVLISIDECQFAFRDSDIKDLVEDLVRRGPAAGIIVCLSTQRPMVDSIPSSIRDNTTARIALRVQTQPANDAILGAGAYSGGLDATRFTAADRGVGIVAGEGADGTVAKMAFLSTDSARAIALRHPRVKEIAAPDSDSGSVVDHIVAVWPGSQDRAACSQIAELLAVDGGEYWGWQAADVTAALKAHEITTRVAKVDGKAVKAVFRADLLFSRGEPVLPSTPQPA